MTLEQFPNTSNPDSEKSCIGVVTCKGNKESGLFCAYDKRVSKRFWLKHSEYFLTQNEEVLLNSIPYKKKTFGTNRKAKRAATIVISLIRKFCNGKYNAQLSRDILGKLLKSNDTADSILNALVAGSVIESNGYSNREHKIALKWRFTNSFTKRIQTRFLANGFESQGLKKRSILSNLTPSEAIIEGFASSLSAKPSEEPRGAFSEQKQDIQEEGQFLISFPENSAMVFEEIKPTKLNNTKNMNEETTSEDEYQQKLIVQRLSPYFKKRFADFGLDIYGTSHCRCCKEILPNALFSINNRGILDHKCRMCWDNEDKSNAVKDPLEVSKSVGLFAKNLRKGYSSTFAVTR